MSHVSVVLDRIRSARRPSAALRRPAVAGSPFPVAGPSAAEEDGWHAGDARFAAHATAGLAPTAMVPPAAARWTSWDSEAPTVVLLPTPRRSVDLRPHDARAEVGARAVVPAQRGPATSPASAALPQTAPGPTAHGSPPSWRAAHSWSSQPGPTTWFG